ncbi:hypothetical protein [Pelagibaculum spongiae]|uniref:hypothetical protein n=1 Tax=Pelagibaculum spongiae TaxID=2080658 RepID=UPI0015B278EF|nr:hypothetical protein [Pelagibaculum spongiae]
MRKSNRLLLVSVMASLMGVSSLQAAENLSTICASGKQVRLIEVIYPTGKVVPCEVQYTKMENAGAEVSNTLWKAQNSVGFCEKKAAEFTEKQRGWGFNCSTVEPVVINENAPVGESSDAVGDTKGLSVNQIAIEVLVSETVDVINNPNDVSEVNSSGESAAVSADKPTQIQPIEADTTSDTQSKVSDDNLLQVEVVDEQVQTKPAAMETVSVSNQAAVNGKAADAEEISLQSEQIQ